MCCQSCNDDLSYLSGRQQQFCILLANFSPRCVIYVQYIAAAHSEGGEGGGRIHTGAKTILKDLVLLKYLENE